MKVVINRCFGGFGISSKAFEKLLERKGIAYEKALSKHHWHEIDYDYWKEGHSGEENAYLSPYDFTEDRCDPDLIAVVEELGTAADGFAAELSIVDIPDDVEWYIHEYDGMEHVAEKHRTWR